MPNPQPEFPIFTTKPDNRNVWLLVELLREHDWATSAELLKVFQKPPTDANRRWLRSLADASGGRIAGGQRGYKLVEQMTREEYDHWRNWMSHQATEMQRRVIESDKIYFNRKPVHPGHGILQPADPVCSH